MYLGSSDSDVGVFVWLQFALLMIWLDDDKLVCRDSIVAFQLMGLGSVNAECLVHSLDTFLKSVELFAVVAVVATLLCTVCFLFFYHVQFHTAADVLAPAVRAPASFFHDQNHVFVA